MKAIVGRDDDRILGFTMIGAEAGEVMAAVQTAISLQNSRIRYSATPFWRTRPWRRGSARCLKTFRRDLLPFGWTNRSRQLRSLSSGSIGPPAAIWLIAYGYDKRLPVGAPSTNSARTLRMSRFDTNGVLYALGDFSGGLTLYVKEGVLSYEYNLFEITRTLIKAETKLPAGKVKI